MHITLNELVDNTLEKVSGVIAIHKPLLATGVILGSCLFPLQATAASFISELYVFGDSLSDSGKTFSDTGFPPFPYEQRFSNGEVWVEFLADQLGGLAINQ